MSKLVVTVDLDWAPEPAIEETIEFLIQNSIHPTVFITHRSKYIETKMSQLEVGLHPYFAPNSSHGQTIDEVVQYITSLPYNFSGYRCHRFATCNLSAQAMKNAGMKISSNVCTDLEYIRPFKNRYGLTEIPIFLEDGGYLWRQHSLKITPIFKELFLSEGTKVILIHPMHFAINTPNFDYMHQIKQSVNRNTWNNMNVKTLNQLCWKGVGIRDFLKELIQISSQTCRLSELYHNV
jgi:hypothetical protein